ncbi:Ldh family oxidoreductase [Rhizobium sp. LCM 4573]|uniref:Ldh family oxidoreductase n=1 Tax=Rhizobium sp. LCM 4573 TaxID=1848291 RepID=UPI0008D97BAC|nr:Ldh family oxidoreductase [Rhizobium sp. LCM 4573]OHV82886.1 dehydrogenase [Rhizobium sp. LCM 4573]
MRQSPEALRSLTQSLLEKHGAPATHAALQADLLLEAELRGLASHGLQRLPLLLSRLNKGLINAHARGTGEWRRHALLCVDGERGFGPVVVMHAMESLRTVVKDTGIAIAAIRNANHIGMLAYYVEAAARSDLICLVMSTSEALVHPFGGTRPLLGTNPLAIGIPTAEEPFVLDLATSIVSMGKINNHALRDEPIPAGWAVDGEGQATTDPNRAKGGAIAPFGGAKGYGLGLAIELLVATLAGSGFAPMVGGTLDDTRVANKGDLLVLIDPTSGMGNTSALSAYLSQLRRSLPHDPANPVTVPGDRARARRAVALVEGIDIPQPLFQQLTALAAA